MQILLPEPEFLSHCCFFICDDTTVFVVVGWTRLCAEPGLNIIKCLLLEQ